MLHHKKRQSGVILYVVVMIFLLVSILVLIGVRSAHNDMKIGIAQAEQVQAFDQAEAMLSRVRFAMEQIPLPPSISVDKPADYNTSSVIWVTNQLDSLNSSKEKKSSEPQFAQSGFEWSRGMTCVQLSAWLQRNGSAVDLSCDGIFAKDAKKQPRIFIEFITRQQAVGDIDENRGMYFYRITILGQGFLSGRNIVQGITGVQYI